MSQIGLFFNWFRVAWRFRAVPPWNARFISLRPLTKAEIERARELAEEYRWEQMG